MQTSVFLLVFVAVVDVNAIIPEPCANVKSLTTGMCCPTPNFPNAGPCGSNLTRKRGSCKQLSVPDEYSMFIENTNDIRMNWPFQYFNRVCVCENNYGGYDCGECSYGYNDGADCTKKTIRRRVPVTKMDAKAWKRYRTALQQIKTTKSRYMVSIDPFPGLCNANIFSSVCATTEKLAKKVVDTLVQPKTYDLFVWLHHFVAKDNDVTLTGTYTCVK